MVNYNIKNAVRQVKSILVFFYFFTVPLYFHVLKT